MGIYKRADGSYFVSVSLGSDLKGKRIRATKVCANYQEAKTVESDFMLNAVRIAHTKKKTVDDIFDIYITEIGREKTKYTQQVIYNAHIKPYFGNKLADKLLVSDFIEWKRIIGELDLSQSYKIGIFKTIRSIFNFAEKLDYIKVNHFRKIKNFEQIKKRQDYWTLEEFKQFIAGVEIVEYELLFKLLFFTGVRLGEARHLRWHHLDNNKIHIEGTRTFLRGKGWQDSPPKTNSSYRTIALPAGLSDELAEFKRECKKHRVEFDKDSLIISRIDGQTPPEASTTKYFNEVIAKTGVKKIRIHDLRHSHASLLINVLKKDALNVKERLGHSSISTTLDIYSHLYDDAEQKIADELSNLF